jgi:uncharacterized protein with FMN-binding domain
MPKRGFAALIITTGALILLLSFKTPDQTLPVGGGGVVVDQPVGATPSPAATASAPGATSAPAVAGATPAASPAPTAATGGASKTVDGPVVSTQYGDVQVEVVVANGKLKDVVALSLPTGRRSGQISSYAAPILHQEALQAQSAKIDLVSGATYTSDAYAQSLQAALDQAGLT